MKLSKCFTYLFWVLLSIWTMSSNLENELSDQLYYCFRDHICDKNYFNQLRRCWFLLAPDSKNVIQTCLSRSCGIQVADFFTMREICDLNISTSSQKSCFSMCAHVLETYEGLLRKEIEYYYIYESLQKSKVCMKSVIGHCLPS